MVKKKISWVVVGALFLIGCTNETEEDLPEEEVMEEDQEDLEELAEEPSGIEFLPQESDLADGVDTESDPILEEVEEWIATIPESDLAEPGTVGLTYTGVIVEAEETDERQAVLVLTNLMDDSIEEMEMTFSFGASEEEHIIEEDTVILDESFGILEPYQSRPLYIYIDPDNQDQLEDLSAEDHYTHIHDFDYDVAGERNP